ncbi:MAG: M15 family metallopeptidase [Acetatifactor sp.]
MKKIVLDREDLHRGILILVNEKYKIAWDVPKGLAVIGNTGRPEGLNDETLKRQANADALTGHPEDVLLERQAGARLEQLMDEIDGWDVIAPVSGWRSRGEQQSIWDESMRDNGSEYTRTYVALPGHSEHQTGLAIDLGLRREHIDFICPEFPDTGVCGQFRERAADYGFVLRYPAGKENITGIGHEPWHFRYVGVPHARIMTEQGMTLEEYTDYIRQFDSPVHPCCIRVDGRAVCVSYVPADRGQTAVWVNETAPYCISGNNVDGFVLTQWLGAEQRRQ